MRRRRRNRRRRASNNSPVYIGAPPQTVDAYRSFSQVGMKPEVAFFLSMGKLVLDFALDKIFPNIKGPKPAPMDLRQAGRLEGVRSVLRSSKN